jgi:hypothetical protein
VLDSVEASGRTRPGASTLSSTSVARAIRRERVDAPQVRELTRDDAARATPRLDVDSASANARLATNALLPALGRLTAACSEAPLLGHTPTP